MDGEITLVFTDIQGSTKLWEAHGAAFQVALDLHNQVIRTSIERHMGYEVKTEGDSFMVAFRSVFNAIQFCMDAQQQLHLAPWPDFLSPHMRDTPVASAGDARRGLLVRMAVHTGEPAAKINPLTGRADYFGPSVNRAARLCAAAHGGQVLISSKSLELTWDILEHQHQLPGQLTDLGHHALRGLVPLNTYGNFTV